MRREFFIFAVAVVTGCSTPTHTLRFHEEVPGNLPASRVRFATIPNTGQHIPINPYPSINERDVDEAHVKKTNAGPAVLIRFSTHGATELAEMTTRLRGQFFVVLVDEKPVAAVLVEHAIKDGEFLLLGDLSDATAQELVDSLNKLAGCPRDSGDMRLTP